MDVILFGVSETVIFQLAIKGKDFSLDEMCLDAIPLAASCTLVGGLLTDGALPVTHRENLGTYIGPLGQEGGNRLGILVPNSESNIATININHRCLHA